MNCMNNMTVNMADLHNTKDMTVNMQGLIDFNNTMTEMANLNPDMTDMTNLNVNMFEVDNLNNGTTNIATLNNDTINMVNLNNSTANVTDNTNMTGVDATTNATNHECKKGDQHSWTKRGVLIIEKCEKYCQFCAEDGRDTKFNYAWHLRRHVSQTHCCQEYAGQLTVAGGWTGAPNGNDKTGFRNRKAKKAAYRAASPLTPPQSQATETSVVPASQALTLGMGSPAPPLDLTTPPEELPASAPPPVLEGTIGCDADTIDPALFAPPSGLENDSFGSWCLPQLARTDQQPIQGHSPADLGVFGPAGELVSVLNTTVGDAIAAEGLSGPEALYVLENWVAAFRAGRMF